MRVPDEIEGTQAIWDDPERLRKWTLEQLDLQDLRLPAKNPRLYVRCLIRLSSGMPDNSRAKIVRLGGEVLQFQESTTRWLESISEVQRAGDEVFAKMEALGFLLRGESAPKVKGGGRPRGRAEGLAEAVADIARIRGLWQETFGKRNRKNPSAIDIAAERHEFTTAQLVNYRKNSAR
jgi:hypothetical protein